MFYKVCTGIYATVFFATRRRVMCRLKFQKAASQSVSAMILIRVYDMKTINSMRS